MELTAIKTNSGCPKCGSVIFTDDDGPFCLCGWRPRRYDPELKIVALEKTVYAGIAELEAHRAEITEDYTVKGLHRTPLCEKWKMDRRTWERIKKEWNLHTRGRNG